MRCPSLPSLVSANLKQQVSDTNHDLAASLRTFGVGLPSYSFK